MPWASRAWKIVPLGGTSSLRASVVRPSDVPAMRKRRFGYVWAPTEQNHRSHTGKVAASELTNGSTSGVT